MLEDRQIEELLATTDLRIFADQLYNFCKTKKNVAAAGFMPFGVFSVDRDNMALRLAHGFGNYDEFAAMWPLLPRYPDFTIELACHPRRCLNTYEIALRAGVTHLPVYTDYFEPIEISQLLNGLITRSGGVPGSLVLCRSARAPLFDAQEQAAWAVLRDRLETHIRTLVGAWPKDSPVADLASSISATSPRPLFLFDKQGRLRWTSGAADLRLIVEGDVAPRYLDFGGDWRLVDAMRECAQRATLSRSELHRAVHQARKVLRPGEYLLARDDAKHVMFEVVKEAPPPIPTNTVARKADLSPTQRCVAELRADGYTIANIAAILGRSEGTVKTHLNAIRRKLKVVSAVEICLKLRGMQATSFDEPHQVKVGLS
jgi:DNA-binding CsgD family transcriptional regulator